MSLNSGNPCMPAHASLAPPNQSCETLQPCGSELIKAGSQSFYMSRLTCEFGRAPLKVLQ